MVGSNPASHFGIVFMRSSEFVSLARYGGYLEYEKMRADWFLIDEGSPLVKVMYVWEYSAELSVSACHPSPTISPR